MKFTEFESTVDKFLVKHETLNDYTDGYLSFADVCICERLQGQNLPAENGSSLSDELRQALISLSA